MGQVASDLKSVMAVVNGAEAVFHDCSVFVHIACKSKCNFCGCWKFGFQPFETHEDDIDSSMVPCYGD